MRHNNTFHMWFWKFCESAPSMQSSGKYMWNLSLLFIAFYYLYWKHCNQILKCLVSTEKWGAQRTGRERGECSQFSSIFVATKQFQPHNASPALYLILEKWLGGGGYPVKYNAKQNNRKNFLKPHHFSNGPFLKWRNAMNNSHYCPIRIDILSFDTQLQWLLCLKSCHCNH